MLIWGNNDVFEGGKGNIDQDGQSEKTLHSRPGLALNA